MSTNALRLVVDVALLLIGLGLVVFYIRSRLRIRRWILAGVFLALPALTVTTAVVWVFQAPFDGTVPGTAALPSRSPGSTGTTATSGTTPTTDTTPTTGGTDTTTVRTDTTGTTQAGGTPQSCADAQALATSDPDAARAALVRLRDGNNPEGVRACAAEALAEVDKGAVAARLADIPERELELLSWVLGDRVTTGPMDGPGVAAFLLINVLLALLALREIQLWRSERNPWPVTVKPPILDKALADNAQVVAETIKVKLSGAGVLPGSGGLGELGSLVIEAVSVSDPGDRNWFATLTGMLGRWFRLPKGYTVEVAGGRWPTDVEAPATVPAPATTTRPLNRLSVSISVTRSGEVVSVFDVCDPDLFCAATKIAYRVYLELTNREEVRRRTPAWLAWTSVDALQSYHEALDRQDDGDYLGAIRLLEAAARQEPGNSLVAQLAGRCYLWVALGHLDENVLRPDDCRFRRRQYVLGLLWHLRAAARAPESGPARAKLAVVLGYAEHWSASFTADELGAQTFADTAQLLGIVRQDTGRRWRSRTTRWTLWRDRHDAPAPYAPVAEMPLGLALDQAIEQWRKAESELGRWRCARRWWRLTTRRDADGMALPFSRARARLLLQWRAGRLTMEWNRFATDEHRLFPGWKLEAESDKVLSRAERLDGEKGGDARYNAAMLAIAMARGYRQLPWFWDPEVPMAHAERLLLAAHRADGVRLSAEDLNFIHVDPDIRHTLEDPPLRELAARFSSETAEDRTSRVRGEAIDDLRHAAFTMRQAWASRRLHLRHGAAALGSDTPLRPTLCRWFDHDKEVWRALDDWWRSPAVRDERLRFTSLVDDPPPVPAHAELVPFRPPKTVPTAADPATLLSSPGPHRPALMTAHQWSASKSEAEGRSRRMSSWALGRYDDRELEWLALKLAERAAERWQAAFLWANDHFKSTFEAAHATSEATDRAATDGGHTEPATPPHPG